MTALEPSISVNVFSDTAELLAYYRIQQRSLESLTPFLKSPSEVRGSWKKLSVLTAETSRNETTLTWGAGRLFLFPPNRLPSRCASFS